VRLPALIHLVAATRALTRCEDVLVLGSAALLASHADLGEADGPVTLTRDLDLLLNPCDEALAAVVHEALGEGSLFDQRFGVHVDVLRPTITSTLAAGWAQRAVPVPGAEARALAPADIAAVKLRVGRPKDLELVGILLTLGLVEEQTVADLLGRMTWSEREMQAAFRRLGACRTNVRKGS